MGEPGLPPQTMEELARRASALREALERSQGNTESMVAVLGSFDNILSAIEADMRPTQVNLDSVVMGVISLVPFQLQRLQFIYKNLCCAISPWSNKYDPPLEDGTVPSEEMRNLEIEANDVFSVYCDQYYEGGISSVYIWEIHWTRFISGRPEKWFALFGRHRKY